MKFLKKNAPTDLIRAIQEIEDRGDRCHEQLTLLKKPRNVVMWLTLVESVNLIESEIAARGETSPWLDATLRNVGRCSAILINWSHQYGRPISRLANRRWTPAAAAVVREALQTANAYEAFLGCMPLWHRNRYSAELVSPTCVRFTELDDARLRQVSAYQKSVRPIDGLSRGRRLKKMEPTSETKEQLEIVLQSARKTGQRRFRYDTPWSLWEALRSQFLPMMNGVVRRSDSLSLGPYDLKDFKRFYGSLLAICAGHEYLCAAWCHRHGEYPSDSAVLVESRLQWCHILSALSGLQPNSALAIIDDLTFRAPESIDLHVSPFVPLDPSMTRLALAPPFPLHSRPDDNILHVCSKSRPAVFSLTTGQKEPEMRSALESIGSAHSLRGPIKLPDPTPDIDLLIREEKSSTIVIAELKWLKKNLRSVELLSRDEELMVGIDQLKNIRKFLRNEPDHLASIGHLSRAVNEYTNIYYLLVARGHWTWVAPMDGVATVEFDAFAGALSEAIGLDTAMNRLLSFDWLPVEGRDFVVEHELRTVNGVSIECEIFYPTMLNLV